MLSLRTLTVKKMFWQSSLNRLSFMNIDSKECSGNVFGTDFPLRTLTIKMFWQRMWNRLSFKNIDNKNVLTTYLEYTFL